MIEIRKVILLKLATARAGKGISEQPEPQKGKITKKETEAKDSFPSEIEEGRMLHFKIANTGEEFAFLMF